MITIIIITFALLLYIIGIFFFRECVKKYYEYYSTLEPGPEDVFMMFIFGVNIISGFMLLNLISGEKEENSNKSTLAKKLFKKEVPHENRNNYV